MNWYASRVHANAGTNNSLVDTPVMQRMSPEAIASYYATIFIPWMLKVHAALPHCIVLVGYAFVVR